jgi:tetratricopeptide (TPR) repeat protein
MLGIYIAVLTIGGTVLYIVTGKPADAMKAPPMLGEDQIADALTERPTLTPNLKLMSSRVEQAMAIYQQSGQDTRKLYQCVKAFDEALSYSGKNFFDDPDHEKAYRAALKALTERITDRYRNAMLLEKAQNWAKAEREFSELLAIFAGYSAISDKDVLFSNVQAHHRYIKANLLRKSPTKRMPWV